MKDTVLIGRIEKQPPLRKIVYEQLKNAILTDAIPKGVRLYESKIAKEIGISRAPVREAMHALERELLIVAVDKVGYEIVDLSPKDLEEVSEIRKTVETLALKEAIGHIGQKQIGQLENNLKKSAEAVKANKVELFILLDAEFHALLCSLSNSPRLIRMAEGLRKEMTRFRYRMKSHRKLCTASFEYHQRIVGYLKTKDDLNAINVLIEHIDNAKGEMLRQIVKMT